MACTLEDKVGCIRKYEGSKFESLHEVTVVINVMHRKCLEERKKVPLTRQESAQGEQGRPCKGAIGACALCLVPCAHPKN